MKRLITFYFFIVWPLLSFGQNINYYSFNDLYRFNASTIYDIQQDSTGNFWFGTNSGIYKFDGADFHHFVLPYYNTEFTNIKFDAEGGVWFSNFGGQLFKIKDGEVSIVIDSPNEVGFISNYFVLPPNVYYLYDSKASLYKYNPETELYDTVINKSGSGVFNSNFEDDKIILHRSYTEPGKNQLGIQQINYDVKRNISSSTNIGSINLYKTEILRIEHSNRGNLLSQTHEHTDVYLLKSGEKLFSLPFNLQKFNGIETIDSTTYFFTKDSLVEIVPQRRTLINDKNVSCLKKDREGNLWIGTLDEGILISANPKASHRRISESKIEHYTFTRDSGLLFNTANGNIQLLKVPYNSNPLPVFEDVSVGPIVVFPDQHRFFSGKTERIYDLKTGKITRTHDDVLFKEAVFVDSQSFVFTNAVMSSTGKVSANQLRDLHFKKLRSKRSVKVANVHSTPGFYVDYIDGLYYYRSPSVAGTPVKHEGVRLLISAVSRENDSTVWIADNADRLLQLQGEKVIRELYFPFHVEAIAVQDSFLLAHNKTEVYVINLLNDDVQILNQEDGLLKQVIKGAFFHNERIHILSSNSIQSLPLRKSFKNNRPPLVSLEEIKLFNKKADAEQIKNLSYDQNNLTFILKGISIKSQGHISFQHQLKGVDSNWVTTPEQKPEIRLSNLAPGDYTFLYKACNSNDICTDSRVIKFSISPPFYRTSYFIAALLGVLIILIWGSVQLYVIARERRMKAKQKTKELERKFYKAKISAIRSQMNPHFLFNALNTIQEFILTNQKNIAGEYLADFADLMRTYLNQSKNDKIILQDEVDMLRIYLRLENLRFEDSIKYEIQVCPEINPETAEIPVMLVQPFVENSIKHGLLKKKGNRRLTVRFALSGGQTLLCTIEDNGIGRKASAHQKKSPLHEQHHRSFATEALNERIDLLNSKYSQKVTFEIIDLYDAGNNASGTRVEISISPSERKAPR